MTGWFKPIGAFVKDLASYGTAALPRRWIGIAIHHGANKPTTSAAEVDTVHKKKGWRRWAPFLKRFFSIGYHAVVSYDDSPKTLSLRKWVIERGRPTTIRGAHLRWWNGRLLGLCVSGNWMTEAPPAEAWRLVVVQCAQWCMEFGISPDKIIGHRDKGKTLCPGDAFYVLLGKLRADVATEIERMAA